VATHRQAGHYTRNTNTAAGLASALNELQTNGRAGVFRMIVLLSDGNADMLDDGTTSVSSATTAAKQEAQAIAAAHIPVITIGLGALADTSLMQYIADTTQQVATNKGICFMVPGGQSVDDYRTQLMTDFGELAVQLPLKLVN